MKNIEFTSTTGQRIYNDYIKRVKRCTNILSKDDKDDILMEINSHIFEGMQRSSTKDETENLLTVIEKLGAPEEYLKPIIADKKINQATRTFNPINVFQALVLNLKNGLVFSVFALLYLSLFSFVFLIFTKIFFPSKTGLFYQNENFQALGFIENTDGMEEILGFWFIPLVLFLVIIFYLLITLLLRVTKKK